MFELMGKVLCRLGFHRWGPKSWRYDDIDWTAAYKRRCQRCRKWSGLIRPDGKSADEARTAVAAALRARASNESHNHV